MRVNAENCLRSYRSKASHLGWLLEDLIRNMKELRDRQAAGDGAAALEEFLVLYCIKEPAPPLVHIPNLTGELSFADMEATEKLKALLARLGKSYPTQGPPYCQLNGLLFQLAPHRGPELQLKECPDTQLEPEPLQPWADPEVARQLCALAAIWAEEHEKTFPKPDGEAQAWASRVLGLGYQLLKAKRAANMEGGPRG